MGGDVMVMTEIQLTAERLVLLLRRRARLTAKPEDEQLVVNANMLARGIDVRAEQIRSEEPVIRRVRP
jgi:hypothetical protein